MRISREQLFQLQEIIKETSIHISAFEVSGNDADEIGFKFKANYFAFGVTKIASSKYKCLYSTVRKKNAVGVELAWDGVLSNFRSWTKAIEEDILIQLDWEAPVDSLQENLDDKRPLKQKIKETVEDGNLKVALEMLQKYYEEKDRDIFFTTILKMSELNEIEKMILNDQFTREESKVRKTNLKRNILEIADKVE